MWDSQTLQTVADLQQRAATWYHQTRFKGEADYLAIGSDLEQHLATLPQTIRQPLIALLDPERISEIINQYESEIEEA